MNATEVKNMKSIQLRPQHITHAHALLQHDSYQWTKTCANMHFLFNFRSKFSKILEILEQTTESFHMWDDIR